MVQRITLKDIAVKANVSVMTVSFALRGKKEVAESTRVKIVKMAEEMGYKPDPVLQSLIAYRTNSQDHAFQGCVGFLNCLPSPIQKSGKKYAMEYFFGAKRKAEQMGYTLNEFWLQEPGMKLRRLVEIIKTRGVLGLLIAPLPEPNFPLELPWEDFSLVAYGHSLSQPRLHQVAANQFNSVMTCMEEMVKLGYQRIGLVLRKREAYFVVKRWTAAYLLGQQIHMKPENRLPILVMENFEGAILNEWLRNQKPDVLIGTGMIYRYLVEEGWNIPQEMGFVEPYTYYSQENSICTRIDEQSQIIGERGMELLGSLIKNGEKGLPSSPISLLIDPVWVPGKTTAPVSIGIEAMISSPETTPMGVNSGAV